MKIDKKLILNKLKNYYSFKMDSDFARFLEVKPQTLSSWYSRNTFDIDILYSKCIGINSDWLLTGNGVMFRENDKPQVPTKSIAAPGASNDYKDDLIVLQKEKINQLQLALKTCEDEKKMTANNKNVSL